MTSSIPVLRSADYPAARAFWVEVMGFAVGEEGGDPVRFGIFHKDQAVVFVDAWHGADQVRSPAWRAYFHCDDVDALAGAVRGRGYSVDGPRDAVYGMREVSLRDPDGNLLCFGQEIAPQAG
nr:VOC family protein [Pseudoruegeria sp. HB172150]